MIMLITIVKFDTINLTIDIIIKLKKMIQSEIIN